jgi:hypothetical protein
MDELLETDFAVAAKDRWLYRCLDCFGPDGVDSTLGVNRTH